MEENDGTKTNRFSSGIVANSFKTTGNERRRITNHGDYPSI